MKFLKFLIPLVALCAGAFAVTQIETIDSVTGQRTKVTVTGSGAPVLANTPTLITPVAGAATGSSVTVSGTVYSFSATAIPAGGTAGSGFKFSSTSNYGLFFGSGVPTLAAAQGSLYLRSDGAPYYNTNGTTGWNSILVNGGALGTPASGVATNFTGTAAGLTAGTVTTNANLTGEVTSSGNAATIADSVTVTGWVMGASTATTPSVSDNDTSLATTAFVQGERAIVTKVTAASYTIGTTDARELYGGVIYATGAATITIPAVAAGASFTVITLGAIAVSVDPNAADLIYLNGTALSDGDKITNASTTGDIAVFTYYDATGWYATTNTGWTDTN